MSDLDVIEAMLVNLKEDMTEIKQDIKRISDTKVSSESCSLYRESIEKDIIPARRVMWVMLSGVVTGGLAYLFTLLKNILEGGST